MSDIDPAAAQRALTGVRVLDLTQHESGSVCCQMLGWLGADVIKIEVPKTGDPGRKIGSPLQTSAPDPNGKDAWYFLMHNSNKRGLTLDLKTKEGKEIFLSLVAKADVVAENFGPGTWERLGLEYPVLAKINPRIILARIKGFGLTGPYSGFGSFDTISQAVGGMLALTGPEGGGPLKTGPSVADSSSGILACLGVVSALHQRHTTGRGQQVEISMQEALMNLCRGRISDYYIAEPHKAPSRKGNALTKGVPSGLFPSKGGGPNDYVYMIVHTALQPKVKVWENFLKVIDREDLIGNERYSTTEGRTKHRAEVDAFVTEWTMKHTKYEVMEKLGAAKILCGAVLDISDHLYDRHLVERNAIIEYDHPSRGRIRVPACPIRLSDSSTETRRPPLIGEHTDEVLADLLGFDEAKLKNLRDAGII